MAGRQSQDSEFNCDGMMDVVTNLAGGLILLVVLLLAITRPLTEGVDKLPTEQNRVGGEQTMDVLLQQMHTMRMQLDEIDRDVGGLEVRLFDIAGDIDVMRQPLQEL